MGAMSDATATEAERLWLADWRRRVAELYADGARRGRAPTPRRPGRRGRPSGRRCTGTTRRRRSARGAGDVPGAPLAVRRPAAVRGRASSRGRRAARPGSAGLARPRAAQQRRRGPRVRPRRAGDAAAPRRRRHAVAVLDARLHRRPVPARSATRPAAPRRTAPAATSSTRPRARTSAATRRPARSSSTSTSPSSRRAPSTRSGRARSRRRRTAWPRGSRPASGCADPGAALRLASIRAQASLRRLRDRSAGTRRSTNASAHRPMTSGQPATTPTLSATAPSSSGIVRIATPVASVSRAPPRARRRPPGQGGRQAQRVQRGRPDPGDEQARRARDRGRRQPRDDPAGRRRSPARRRSSGAIGRCR